jgi:hypothetical protein
MKRLLNIVAGFVVIALIVAGCGHRLSSDGWVTLIDGDKGLENWNRIGDANWRAEGGAIVADKGKGGHLVSKKSYKDFEIRTEFWAATDTNSGIFIRATDPNKIGSVNSYEVNIWDIRPEPKYGTGAIVDVASVPVPIVNKAGGKWNVMEITAKGDELTVVLNGVVTAFVRDGRFRQGPFSLQYGGGVKGALGGPIKWRKVEVREL